MPRLLILLPLALAAVLPARAEQVTAVTDNNRLLFFDHATPATSARAVAVTGLQAGERLLGIDYRPANGALYGLGSTNRLYTINVDTGAATAVGAAGAFTLSGTRFGFNFNPVVDRIRVVSENDQNLRLNPNDGTLAGTDGTLAFAAGDPNAAANPTIVACAYTNSFVAAGATVLFGIDSSLNALVVQSPPNAGTLETVGPLGFDPNDLVGFDISGASGRAYAAFSVAGVVGLYTLDLATGTSTFVGAIGDPVSLAGGTVTGVAVAGPTTLVNLSARGRVGVDSEELIGGFVARGAASTKVLFRAIGPSLANFGVAGALADPTISIYDSARNLIATNDDWATGSQAAQITATGFAPTNASESAVIVTVAPGAYTAVVRGKNNTTGVALVEAYEVP